MNRIFYMAMLLVTWLSFAPSYADDVVAKIGETDFATLQEAFDAVETGQTITMLTNVTLSAPLNVELADKAVTLDLGDHTLTGRTNLKSGNLTLTNGNVAGGIEQALNVYGSSEPTEDYSVLTIGSDVNVTADVYGVCLFGATASPNGYGAVVNINGHVTTTGDGKNGAVFVSGNLGKNISSDMNNVVNITGVVTSATDAGVALNGNATVNVENDAKITGNTGIAVKRGTLNVKGGTIEGNGEENTTPGANYNGTEMTGAGISMSSTYNQYGPMSVVITGGTVNSSNAKALFKQDGTYQSNATFSVSGGTFSSAVPKEFCAKGYAPADNGNGTFTVQKAAVAQIGDNKYASLADAIAAVPTDGTQTTITMLANEMVNVATSPLTIVAGKNVVLELNGKQIVGSCDSGQSSALITNRGTLTIQDNTDTNADGSGDGKLITGATPTWTWDGSDNYSGSYASNLITNNGTLTITSGYLENISTGSAVYVVDNQTNGGLYTPTATINGGSLKAVSVAVRLFCNSTSKMNTVVMNGGVVIGSNGFSFQNANANANQGTLTISGGTITAKNYGVYLYSYKEDGSNLALNLEGGTITTDASKYSVLTYSGTASSDLAHISITGGTYNNSVYLDGGMVTIEGGTFNGGAWIVSDYGGEAVPSVTGGTFANDVNAYCADGYAAAYKNDAWTVGAVSTTALTPQTATETEATYTASTVVTDANNVEYELSTDQEVNVSVPETGNAGKDVTLADFDMNEVVAKAVAAANTRDNIDVQLIVKAAEPVVSGETVKTVTFEVHPEAIITVNNGEPTNVMLTNDDLAQDATFTFVLDVAGHFNNGDAIKVVHKSERPDETFYSTVIDGKVTVSGITHFSDFELSEITPAAGMVAVNLTTGVQYASLADAIAAVPTNGTATTIAMLDNEVFDAESKLTVATGKNIVLDLNGKTITGSNNSTGNFYFITNNGTLEITDNSASGEGQILFQSTETDYSNERVTIYNLGGTLTLTKGLVKNTTAGGLAYAINNSSNAWGSNVISTFNLNGGRVSAPNGDAALRVYQNCAPGSTLSKNYVNITGGTLDETGIFVDQILYTGGSTDLTTYTGSNIDTQINISGGTVNGLIDMKIRHPFNTSLNITGGDFNNTQIWVRKVSGEYANACGEPTAPMVTISGGDFDFAGGDSFGLAYDYASTSWSSYDKPYNISGGTYDLEVPAQYCADGYEPTDEVAGKYSVQVIDWGSKDITLIDGTSYEDCVGMPVTADVTVSSASYVRTVNPNFCAWYVPFNYTLTSSDINNINFYRINLIANAVAGTEVTSTDQIWVYLTRMEAGEKLTANRPYVFKAKSGSWEQTFTTSGATLCAPATDVRLNNSTTAHNYDFYGTYETTQLSDNSSEHFFYVDYYGQMGYPGGSNTDVGPYRWYIKTTQKGGGAYYAPTFVFTDDSNVTGITDNLEVKTIDCYYDLKGMKIEKPGKGAYLVKFKDGTVKKVVK